MRYQVLKMLTRRVFPTFCGIMFSVSLWAGSPIVKIDFNQAGRSESETNTPGYEPWVSYTNPVSMTFDGVSFTLEKTGAAGVGLKSNWYKAGIGTAKLVSDGVTVDNGNAGGEITLTISGLEAGDHSLLVYLNNVDSPTAGTFSPVDILVNGELVEDNVVPTIRAATNYEAKIVYLTFTVQESENVAITFRAETAGDEDFKNVVVNGIELNTPNMLDQAISPSPENGDEHVVADNGSVALSWTADDEATLHLIYFATDSATVADATTDDAAYKGSQAETEYQLTGLNTQNDYFWRIDEQKEDGTLTKGNIWSFRLAQLSFPGAEGYGRYAKGGRGGKVVHVTNLDDSGEGSLRYAIENETGPRTIVFDVSGLITLQSRLVLASSYVTIAGQTAPGKGICLRDAPFGLSGANDAIVQNIRVRRGNIGDYDHGLDGMGMQGSNNCIIDHCSISWTIDEAFSSRSGKNISLQRTLISEALNVAGHPNYPEGTAHGYAASIGGDVGSFHHNLLAHCEGRNWSLAGGLDGNGYYAGRLDLRNNVVYNWGHRATDGGAMEVNFVGNYYKPGAATNFFYALNMQHEGTGNGTQRAYFDGNVMPGHFDETNQDEGRKFTISNGAIVDWETFVSEPFFESYVETQTAKAAYKDVLSDVGCVQPKLDDHDVRVINESLNGTYTYSGSVSGKAGLPDDQADVSSWEDYPEESRDASWDSDGDGLPNWWENYYNLNINSVEGDYSEANQDLDSDGYTELEDYLQWMAKPHFIQSVNKPITINLTEFFKGYEATASFVAANVTNGSVEITDNVAEFKCATCGMASFILTVTDADGDSKTKEVVAFFTPNNQGSCTPDFSTGMNDLQEKLNDIYVVPNPVNNPSFTLVGFSNGDVIKSVTVIDVSGRVLQKKLLNLQVNGDYRKEFSLPDMNTGIYIVNVEFTNKTEVLRFVKS
ncbi:T9SS type A sorting domain-containing protein [Mangrovibacterium lignilyticum]|uniref:T9SS type A sorting domain-containing protein n=1 Tax=Mangrovibacterium lignilyticum TaxID=2668052 RepID=UPI0013D2FA33|nr:T9SS type A sorting domain-containing protein [Mangrovibacterium lignilyticum]